MVPWVLRVLLRGTTRYYKLYYESLWGTTRGLRYYEWCYRGITRCQLQQLATTFPMDKIKVVFLCLQILTSFVSHYYIFNKTRWSDTKTGSCHENNTAWKVSKYGVFSSPNTGKFGPEKPPYLDTFQAVHTKYLQKWRNDFSVTWKLLSGKLLSGWLQTVNFHPENAHQGKFPPRITTTRKIPI